MDKRIRFIIFIQIVIYIFIPMTLLYSKEPSKEPVKKAEPDFTQLKNSCVDCHNTLQGKLKEPVRMWKASVHGKVGTKCNICHGGNPEADTKILAKSREYNFIGVPKKKEVLGFCGREGCHITELMQFERGPHYRSVLNTGNPNCSSCHGTHNIQRASPDIIKDQTCSACHSLDYSRTIVISLTALEKGVKDINTNISLLHETFADVQDLETRLQRIRHLFRQLIHIFSTGEVQTTQKIIELEISNLLNESSSKVALTKRLDVIYLMTIVFAILTIGGFLVYSLITLFRRR